MKKVKTISVIILLAVMTGCGRSQQLTDDFIIVDVTKSYPEKELILQDFLDVEYIPLDDADEFVTHGIVMSIGKEIIVVTNIPINNGIFFVFDRQTGKGLRKINRKGQGAEEYINPTKIILDEDNDEIFILDNSIRKIQVYDLYGNFKRSLRFSEDIRTYDVLNYDSDHLIYYDVNYIWNVLDGTNFHPSYHIISKQNGSITPKIQFPFEKLITPVTVSGNLPYLPRTWYPMVPYQGNWILMETSSDTVYQYFPNKNTINPIIVRTPSIHSMDPEVFLFVSFLTDSYYFVETVKKEYDRATQTGFPSTDLMYDKRANMIFQYIVYNDDNADKIPVNLKSKPLNHEIAFWHKLEAYQLVEAYEKGQLKGRLKEIAADLDEESNPVIMIAKHRK